MAEINAEGYWRESDSGEMNIFICVDLRSIATTYFAILQVPTECKVEVVCHLQKYVKDSVILTAVFMRIGLGVVEQILHKVSDLLQTCVRLKCL